MKLTLESQVSLLLVREKLLWTSPPPWNTLSTGLADAGDKWLSVFHDFRNRFFIKFPGRDLNGFFGFVQGRYRTRNDIYNT